VYEAYLRLGEQRDKDWPGRAHFIDEALTRLVDLDPRQCRIVDLRFFDGLSVEETAEVPGISPKTVKRDWSFARIAGNEL